MSPLPRRMLGRAASWENPQVHPSPLPERRLTHVGVAVAIRLFVGFPHQILNSPVAEGLNCFIERINRQGNGYGFKRLRIKALFWDTAGERVKYVVKENRLWKSSKPVHSFFTGSNSSFSFNNGYYETTYSIEPEEIPRSRTAPFSVLEYYQLLKAAGFNIL